MSKDVFDDDLNNIHDSEDKIYECTECGKPIENKGVCGRDCFNASML